MVWEEIDSCLYHKRPGQLNFNGHILKRKLSSFMTRFNVQGVTIIYHFGVDWFVRINLRVGSNITFLAFNHYVDHMERIRFPNN